MNKRVATATATFIGGMSMALGLMAAYCVEHNHAAYAFVFGLAAILAPVIIVPIVTQGDWG